jgi:hypothetical protein
MVWFYTVVLAEFQYSNNHSIRNSLPVVRQLEYINVFDLNSFSELVLVE